MRENKKKEILKNLNSPVFAVSRLEMSSAQECRYAYFQPRLEEGRWLKTNPCRKELCNHLSTEKCPLFDSLASN